MTKTDAPTATSDTDVPEGYRLSATRGPYTTHNGPFYHKTTSDGFWHGTRILARHCNSRGIAHGGMLMAFADGLLGTSVWRETGRVGLTVRVTSDFLAPGRRGDWLEGTAEVIRATPIVVFCTARLFVDNRPVLTADGVFRPMARHRIPVPPKGTGIMQRKTQ